MSGVPRDERGSLAVEFAMIAPMLFLIFALIFAYGRAGAVNGLLEAGTRDAARSVTQARSEQEAEEAAQRALDAALADAPQPCRDSLVIDIQGQFELDSPITVVATCEYTIGDLGLPGAPGTITSESSFTSMMDPYRGLE